LQELAAQQSLHVMSQTMRRIIYHALNPELSMFRRLRDVHACGIII